MVVVGVVGGVAAAERLPIFRELLFLLVPACPTRRFVFRLPFVLITQCVTLMTRRAVLRAFLFLVWVGSVYRITKRNAPQQLTHAIPPVAN